MLFRSAIIEPKLFHKVQGIIAARNRRFSDTEMLERLTKLFQRHGYISGLVIDEADGLPSSGAYAHRFGSELPPENWTVTEATI